MATSGSVNYARTRDDIIKRSMRLIGAIEAGEAPTAAETKDAAEALEVMVKEWQADGAHLWAVDEGVLFLTKGDGEYSVGPSGDHASAAYVTSTLSAASAASDTTLTVTSITGVAASDNIGVVLDSGKMHWTTVSGAPSGTTITLAAGVATAAASGNRFFTYTTIINRPLRIVDARLKIDDGNEIPFSDMLSRDAYYDFPLKTSPGKPTQGYYDPQLTNGLFSVFPAPDDSGDVILFTWLRSIEDFDSASNNPDFPQEWLGVLGYGLAVEIGPEYDVPLDRLAWLKGMAAEKKAALLAWDAEPVSVTFEPDLGP